MKLRFTIRDLLWLAVVAALAVGWWIDHRNLSANLPYEYGLPIFDGPAMDNQDTHNLTPQHLHHTNDTLRTDEET